MAQQIALVHRLPTRLFVQLGVPCVLGCLSSLKNGTRPFCGSQASQYDTGRTPDLQRRWLAPLVLLMLLS